MMTSRLEPETKEETTKRKESVLYSLAGREMYAMYNLPIPQW